MAGRSTAKSYYFACSRKIMKKGIHPKYYEKSVITCSCGAILEVGCGFGRNLNWLISQGIRPEILTGADFSRNLLKSAEVPKAVRLLQADVLNLPLATDRFDLVFTHGLLMHLKPADLSRALQELVRVTKRHLIFIEEIRRCPRQLNYFTWAHDYDKIIAGLPLKVLIRENGKYLLRWYLLKKLNTAMPVGLTRPSWRRTILIGCRPG